MRRPAWLPPLNSHENYSINIDILRCNYSPPSRPPHNLKSIDIMLAVDVKFYSEDINKRESCPFNGLSLCWAVNICPFPALHVDLRKRVSDILGDRELVPFKLDKIGCYKETEELEPMLDRSYHNQSHSYNDLASRIADFLFPMMSQYRKIGLVTGLFIEKSVTIPDREFEAWTSWYEEQKRVNPDCFEEEYLRAIGVPRTVHELWYESLLMAYESAGESCIRSLEKLEVGDSQTMACTICLENLGKGEQVTKLPCSHVFHGDCVTNWLKTSHFCPLCRFMLPTSS